MLDDAHPRYPWRNPRKGHVESWFWRANDPASRRAVWLKATVLAPIGRPPVAEAWVVVFRDGETVARKRTVLLDQARFGDAPVEVAGARFDGPVQGAAHPASDAGTRSVGPEGTLSGALDDVAWELAVRPERGPLAARLLLYPREAMLSGGFPKNKLVTPMPIGRFSGSIQAFGERWEVSEWVGMHGHNWGPAHAPEYAWAQVVFTDDDGAAVAMVEAAAGKVEVGPLRTPTLGLMVVRRGEQEWRFDRIFDRWNHRFSRRGLAWSARFRGRAGEALLEVEARPDEVARLDYVNPDGVVRICLNSKLSRARLRVNPVHDDGFSCVSEHGAALEFLGPEG